MISGFCPALLADWAVICAKLLHPENHILTLSPREARWFGHHETASALLSFSTAALLAGPFLLIWVHGVPVYRHVGHETWVGGVIAAGSERLDRKAAFLISKEKKFIVCLLCAFLASVMGRGCVLRLSQFVDEDGSLL